MSIRYLCGFTMALVLLWGGTLRAADTPQQSPESESTKEADTPEESGEKKKQDADKLAKEKKEKKKQDADKLAKEKREKEKADSLKRAKEKKEKEKADSLKLAKKREKEKADSLKRAEKKRKKEKADSLKLVKKREKEKADSLKRVARKKKKHLADSLKLVKKKKKKQRADSLKLAEKKKEKEKADSLQQSREQAEKRKADSLALEKYKQAEDALKGSQKKEKPEDDSLKRAKEKEKQKADSLTLAKEKKEKEKADSLTLAEEKEKQKADSLELAKKKKKQKADSLKLVKKREKQKADSLKRVARKKKKQVADSLRLVKKKKRKERADSLKLARKLKKQKDDSLDLVTGEKKKQLADSLEESREHTDKQAADSLELDTSKQAEDSLQLSQEKEKPDTDSLNIAKKKKKPKVDSLELAKKKEKEKADSLKLARKREKEKADSLKHAAKEKKKQLADSLKLVKKREKQEADSLKLSQEGKDAGRPPVPRTLLRHLFSAGTRGKRGYTIGGSMYYGSDASLVTGIDGRPSIRKNNNEPVDPGTARMVTGELGIGIGVNRALDLSLSMPLHSDITDWGDRKRTVGDLSLSGTFVPGQPSQVFRAGARLSVVVPTGNHENSLLPRHVYYIKSDPANDRDRGVTFADNTVYLHPSLIASLSFKRKFEIHLNFGNVISDSRERFALDGGLALALRPVRPLVLSVELASESRPFFKDRTFGEGFIADPLWLVPAVTVDVPVGITFHLSGDIGLSSGKGTQRSNWHRGGYIYATKATPSFGIGFSLVYRGTLMGFIRSVTTARAIELSALGTIPGDRDSDSIPDSLDACKKSPEDMDGFEDGDGCPEYDNDDDGITDEVDGCPDNPEDNDDFEDKDGCPDYDNDNDQIPDTSDACPDTKGLESNRGCPAEGPFSFNRTVLDEIDFETGTSKIISGTASLDRITEAMKELPRSKIEIQVHTDNQLPVSESADISQRRADALKLYLVSKGIRTDRIKALGLGSEFPIADNSTEAGRAKNRRVEVRRVE